MDNYKQIKQDLDQLRSIVEKSELWVYKGQGPDETMDGASGENEHKKTEVRESQVGAPRQADGPLIARALPVLSSDTNTDYRLGFLCKRLVC